MTKGENFAKGLVARLGVFTMAFASVLLAGCGQGSDSSRRDQVELIPDEAKDGLTRISFLEYEIPPRPEKSSDEMLALGREVYDLNCAVCHGVTGDGRGDAALFLLPRPRSLVDANYRLRTTPIGSIPTDEDLFRSISLGMPGTPMPPWHHILNDEERWALVDYVKTFSPKFNGETELETVEFGDPLPMSDANAKDGRELFVKYACNTCHGDNAVGDGPNAAQLVADAGHKITPRNLTKPSNYKSGYSPEDVVRTVLTGFNGTPMLGYAGTMTTDEAWKIASFVDSVVRPEPVVVAQASRSELHLEDIGDPDVKIRVIERAWKFVPDVIRVKQGQVVEITFEPTDNGLGVGHGFAVSGYDEVAFLNGAMVGLPKTVKFKVDRAGEFIYYCSTQCSTEKLHPLMNGTLIVEPAEAPQTASVK